MNEVSKGNLSRGRDIFTDITKRSPNYAEGWNKLATVNYMMGDVEASLKNIKETLKLEPRHFGSISGRGLCYLKQRRWQSAMIEFKAALDVHPWLLDAQRNLQLSRGQPGKPLHLVQFRLIIQIDYDRPYARRQRIIQMNVKAIINACASINFVHRSSSSQHGFYWLILLYFFQPKLVFFHPHSET